MTWAERQIASGIKLELTPFLPRRCWKKYMGKVFYLKHPLTKRGYEAALLEWAQIKARLDRERPHAAVYQHHRQLFEKAQKWYQHFGVPISERKVAKQVGEYIEWINELLTQPTLPKPIMLLAFSHERPEFFNDFITGEKDVHEARSMPDTAEFRLPYRWQQRIDQLEEKALTKVPQTLEYWLDTYLSRVERRKETFIVKRTADDRAYKLQHFRETIPLGQHVTVVNDKFLEDYHHLLEAACNRTTGKPLSKKSKQEYFKAVRMFIRWCGTNSDCEMMAPGNLGSREFKFREPKGTGRKREQKKEMLWTPDEFQKAISDLPSPYPCYLLLMLNCGFRHTDISNLTQFDLRLNQQRIVIQRQKLNQEETAPVISYRLWDKTAELLKEKVNDHEEFIFANSTGGQVESSIKTWWKRNRAEYGLADKRLDYLRKTGSTIICKMDRNLDSFYLGECLNDTAKINYSFTDGEPCESLDNAIQNLGSQFGFCDPPKQRVELTPEMVQVLQKAGLM
jgi:integrase